MRGAGGRGGLVPVLSKVSVWFQSGFSVLLFTCLTPSSVNAKVDSNASVDSGNTKVDSVNQS